jgi:hypothetical protein
MFSRESMHPEVIAQQSAGCPSARKSSALCQSGCARIANLKPMRLQPAPDQSRPERRVVHVGVGRHQDNIRLIPALGRHLLSRCGQKVAFHVIVSKFVLNLNIDKNISLLYDFRFVECGIARFRVNKAWQGLYVLPGGL